MIAGYSSRACSGACCSSTSILIFAYVLMSWFPIREGVLLDVYRVLASICEPYIGLFRRIAAGRAVGGGGSGLLAARRDTRVTDRAAGMRRAPARAVRDCK